MGKFFTQLFHLQGLTWKHWLVVFFAYTIIHAPVILKDDGKNNLAVHQAKSFLEGKTDIATYGWDASIYEGKYYVGFPPFPALVVLPFVAIFGDHVNSIAISLLFVFASMVLFYQLLMRFVNDVKARLWLFLAFYFGTGFWYALMTSYYINGFAHIICTTLLFALILELSGKQRALLIGLYLGAAFLTRQMTVFYGVIVLYYLFTGNENKKIAFQKLFAFGVSFGVVAFTYLLFNYIRFGSFTETGYQYIRYVGFLKERVDHHGVFSAKYFIFNFYTLFIKGHNINFGGTDMLSIKGMDPFGTSLLIASPFLLCAFKAKFNKLAVWSYVITSSLIILCILFYHNNGWMQINTQRFALDFLPAVMMLVIWGYSSIPSWLFRALVIYSIALNCLSFLIHLKFGG